MRDHAEPASRRDSAASLARRVAEHRMRRGVSESALARQARMSPHYLQQLLQSGPDFDREGYERIAGALHVSLPDLISGRADAPAGQSGPAERAVLVHLTSEECWDRLGSHGIGRLALPGARGPQVFPVNYAVQAKTVVYRTAPQSPGAVTTGDPLSFQTDRLDDRVSHGWSVLVTGTAERIDDTESVEDLAERLVRPWAGGERPLWIRILPSSVTGRRIDAL